MDHRTYDGWLLGLPGVTQDVKWGNDLVYSVGGKMFAVTCLEGADAGRVSFKVEQERFLELTDMPGVVPAPYLARVHWVLLQQPAEHPAEWVRERLLRAYQLVREKLPKKVQAGLGPA
jgi:predicted DNA-binding protein (MmcQ/YjbR family)